MQQQHIAPDISDDHHVVARQRFALLRKIDRGKMTGKMDELIVAVCQSFV